jgi:hypothetical protein
VTDPRAPAVTFVLPGAEDLGTLADLSPDETPNSFQLGEHVWVLQTYLRLARANVPVALSATLPDGGLAVFHTKHRRSVGRLAPTRGGPHLVSLRADGSEAAIADYEVVQNGRFADGKRRFAMPHWPQPGLVPRDLARGTAVRVCTFKGFSRNIHPAFRGREWSDFLASRGIAWHIDAVEFGAAGERRRGLAWHDYSDVDVSLAVRPAGRPLHRDKPASKLVNSWIAGVPALLGPEYAYRELRRSPLDYLEVASAEVAREAIDRLRSDAELYTAMVANGRDRANEFTVEALTKAWTTLLFETIPARIRAGDGQAARRVPIATRAGLRRVARWLAGRPAR